MSSLQPDRSRPLVGLAYAAYVPDLVRRHRHLLDFVEIPFERLRHDPNVGHIIGETRTILHCASLSVAGAVRATEQTIAQIREWSTRMETPWIGEHLAYISAPGPHADTLEIGYTVAPPLNISTLKRVADACAHYEELLGRQLILENPPQYFATPGSTMGQAEFIRALCDQTNIRLLFDISHFLITCKNCRLNPLSTLRGMPMDRIQEIHISGMRQEMNTYWDDHGATATRETFDLLEVVLESARPRAITLEYNWSASFPEDRVIADVNLVHQAIGGARPA